MKNIGLISLIRQFLISKRKLLVFFLFVIFPSKSINNKQIDGLQYDTLTQQHVYTFVEKMPYYKNGDASFLVDFNKYFRYTFSKHSKYPIETKFQFQFVIDNKGKLIGARIYNKLMHELTDFEKAGLNALDSMQNWQAGIHKGKAVNVILTKIIHLDSQ